MRTAPPQGEREERWDPRLSLLASAQRFRYEHHTNQVLRLLESWRKISSPLDREEENRALEFQIAIARGWTDGDAVRVSGSR